MKKIIVFLSVALLIILYLFALNGRYSHVSGEAYVDKWKKELVIFHKQHIIGMLQR